MGIVEGLLLRAARVRHWSELLESARRLAQAQGRLLSAREASEYGLDLLALAESDGLTAQQRQILLMHGEMWLVRPRWDRAELIGLLGKQLQTYRPFSLSPKIDGEIDNIMGELEEIRAPEF